MCGRLAQARAAQKYLASLGIQVPLLGRDPEQAISRYNVAPHSRVDLIRASGDGLIWVQEKWGWQPSWATPVKSDINTTREKVVSSKYFQQIWPHRALLCADGWYERCVVEGEKITRPYYIHRHDDEPLFIPAVGKFSALGDEPSAGDGFRIITADSQGGMLNVHDRRPVVFSADDAKAWLSDIALEQADLLLQNSALPEEAFRWHAVGREVGNVRNEGERLIAPFPELNRAHLSISERYRPASSQGQP